MKLTSVLFVLALVVAAFAAPIEWPSEYHLEIESTLPYANITHSMTVDVSHEIGAMKVSYFDDMDYTVFLFPNGPKAKDVTGWYVYVNGMKGEQECVNLADMSENPEEAPAIPAYLPDLNDGQWILVSRDQVVRGVKVHKWTLTNHQGEKTMYYEFYITPAGVPMRWVQRGLNTVFGSHFDNYQFDYLVFKPHWTAPHFEAIPTDMCHHKKAVKKSGNAAVAFHAQLMPITSKDLPTVSFQAEGEVDEHFESWAASHGRKYSSHEERQRRQSIFQARRDWVAETNARAEGRFGVELNHHADRTLEELMTIHGTTLRDNNQDRYVNAPSLFNDHFTKDDLPKHVDWRVDGLVDSVRDQAYCGSCWTFSAIGCMEARYALKHRNDGGDEPKFRAFSEQAIVDCFWTPEGSDGPNAGCDGGDTGDAFNWLKDEKKGVAFLDEYPYVGLDQYCTANWHNESKYTIKNIVYVKAGDEDELLAALSSGPVAIGIAVTEELMFYSYGIIDLPKTSENQIAHGVVLVGYGTSLDGTEYWTIRNSWSANWGNNGYFYIKKGENQIALASRASFVEFND